MDDKYKNYCIGPYEKGDVIEVLICKDIDDGYRYEPETKYWYVYDFNLIWMGTYDRNSTDEIIQLLEPKTNGLKRTFGQLSDFGDFDSSYILEHRKIEVLPHANWKPTTQPREQILFTEPT